MAKQPIVRRDVKKSGNFLRTILIWSGIVMAVAALALVMFWPGNEKVVTYLILVTLVAFGVVLLDFDVDDDD